MGLVTNQRPAKELFKPYTDEEKAALAKKYTPTQMRVIEAGEEVVTAEDLDNRGVIRTDIGTLPYLDDLSVLRTVVDKKPQYSGPIDPNTRFMTEDELGRSLSDYIDKLKAEHPEPSPDDPDYRSKLHPNRVELERAIYETPSFMGTYGPLPYSPSAVAPKIPKSFSVEDGRKKIVVEEEEDQRDPDGVYKNLQKQTGYTLDEILNFKVKVLVTHRVVNQTRLGKVDSLYCLAIAGNGNGRLGIGQAKGQEAENTSTLAKMAAIRNMQPIPRYEERTIFGEVEGKVSAVEVKLSARPPGMVSLSQYGYNLT
jgi:small subunit ribosomal protein S5